MMDQIREWLMAVITVSVVAAGAQSLMPPGGVRQVGGLVCGLALLCVFLRPIYALEHIPIAKVLEEYTVELRTGERELERQAEQNRKRVIEEFCGAYVQEQASEWGVDCRVEIVCGMGEDGLWIPESASLWGRFDGLSQSRLTQLLEDELGISPFAQTYYLT